MPSYVTKLVALLDSKCTAGSSAGGTIAAATANQAKKKPTAAGHWIGAKHWPTKSGTYWQREWKRRGESVCLWPFVCRNTCKRSCQTKITENYCKIPHFCHVYIDGATIAVCAVCENLCKFKIIRFSSADRSGNSLHRLERSKELFYSYLFKFRPFIICEPGPFLQIHLIIFFKTFYQQIVLCLFLPPPHFFCLYTIIWLISSIFVVAPFFPFSWGIDAPLCCWLYVFAIKELFEKMAKNAMFLRALFPHFCFCWWMGCFSVDPF